MCSAMFVVRLFSVLLVASLVDGQNIDQQEGHKITVRLPETKPDDHDRTMEQKLWTPEISVHLLSLVEKINENFATWDGRFGHLEDQVTSQQGSLTTLQANVDNMKSQMADVENRLEKQISKISTDISDKIENEVNDLEDKLISKVTELMKNKPTYTHPSVVSPLGLGQEVHNFGSFLVDGMNQRLEKLTRSFDQDQKELLGQFRNITDGLESKISDAADTLVKVGDQMSENVSVSWLNVREDIEGLAESLIVELHNVTSPLYEKVEGATSLLMSSVGKLEELPERVNDKMGTQLSNISQKLSNEMDNEFEIMNKVLEKSFENMSLSFDGVNSKIDNYNKPSLATCKKGMLKRSTLPPYPYPVVYYYVGTNDETKYLCDTTTAGGGWIIIQKRTKGDTDFYRGWEDYKHGFGSIDTDFWIGLDTINKLTSSASYELRIELKYKNKTAYASYGYFGVGSEEYGYTLNVRSYSGTAGDDLKYNSLRDFSTKDRDNDGHSGKNCAVDRQGAWWYGDCGYSNLNGKWGGQEVKGPFWLKLSGYNPTSYTEMKIRRVDN